jgi:transcriptional regulator with XRE-family HTH domain
MSKRTFGKMMPRALAQQLQLMGEQIMLARKRRHLSMQDIADRATVTRLTVSKVEHGDPTVAMGIYARVLFALNLEKDISLLAANDPLGRLLQDAELLRNENKR